MGRIARIAVPPLVVLAVAYALRQPEQPSPPPPASGPSTVPPAEIAPQPANRILVLAEDPAPLAQALRGRLSSEVQIVELAPTQARRVQERRGIQHLPAVIIERRGRESVPVVGDGAVAESIVERCRQLGVPTAEDAE